MINVEEDHFVRAEIKEYLKELGLYCMNKLNMLISISINIIMIVEKIDRHCYPFQMRHVRVNPTGFFFPACKRQIISTEDINYGVLWI